MTADIDDAGRIVGAVVLGLCGLLTGAAVKSSRIQLSVIWGASAIGVAIQLRLGSALTTVLAFSVVSAVIFGVVRAVTPRIAHRRYASSRVTALGHTALAVAFVARLAPAMQGRINSGQFVLAGLSVQLGEFSRLLAVAGVGLVAWSVLGSAGMRRFNRAEIKGAIIGGLLFAVNMALLLVVDTGPAIVLAASACIMIVLSIARIRPLLRRAQLWVLAVVLFALAWTFAAQFQVFNRLAQRWSNVSAPDEQLSMALRAAQGGGLIGHGIGTSPLAAHIPVASSDFVPAVLAADLGFLALGLITAALLSSYGSMLVRVATQRTPLAVLAAGLLTGLSVQTVMTILGSMGAIPLTGLSTPAIAATGSTMLSTFMALAFSAAAIDSFRMLPRETGTTPPATRPHRAVTGISAGILAYLAALAVLPADPASTYFYLTRGNITTADGATIASSESNGKRLYPAGTLYTDIGHVQDGYGDYGLESMYRPQLTCGGHPSLTDTVLQLFRPPACVAANVTTTIRSDVQKAVASVSAGLDAQTVVTDSSTGEILALYSTGQTDPAQLTAGHPPVAPSRLVASAPGSTFKLIVAAAALLNNTDSSAAPREVVKAGGAELHNSENFTCPDPSIETMLAYSCNTTAGFLALQLGQNELERVAKEYFGAETWGRFDGGDLAPLTIAPDGTPLTAAQLMRTGIGQESVEASPLAMNAATAVIAQSALRGQNDAIPAPHLVASVCDSTGKVASQTPGTVGKMLPREVASRILQGMHDATGFGTVAFLGKAGADLGRDVAAKSGTAEVSHETSPTGVDSWITVIVDSRWIITARAHAADPAKVNEAAEIAAKVLPVIPRSNIPTNSSCG